MTTPRNPTERREHATRVRAAYGLACQALDDLDDPELLGFVRDPPLEPQHLSDVASDLLGVAARLIAAAALVAGEQRVDRATMVAGQRAADHLGDLPA